jgi:hypothetical protein
MRGILKTTKKWSPYLTELKKDWLQYQGLTSCSSTFCPWVDSSSPSNVGGMLLLMLKVTVTLEK